jgi:hypothetical protein
MKTDDGMMIDTITTKMTKVLEHPLRQASFKRHCGRLTKIVSVYHVQQKFKTKWLNLDTIATSMTNDIYYGLENAQ